MINNIYYYLNLQDNNITPDVQKLGLWGIKFDFLNFLVQSSKKRSIGMLRFGFIKLLSLFLKSYAFGALFKIAEYSVVGVEDIIYNTY